MGNPPLIEDHGGRVAYAGLADDLCDALVASTNGQILSRDVELEFDDRTRLDLLLTLDVGGQTAKIAVETLRHAYPRDVQAAIWRLGEYQLSAQDRKHVIPLVAAESLSPGARETLRKRGVGYFERNGNLFLQHQNWLINIQKPERDATRRGATSLFTEAREMVIHALLVNRKRWLTGGELADISQTSPYTCSIVLQELERLEWCESSGSGRTLRRRLSKPRELLDAWAENWKKRKDKSTRWFFFADRPKLLLLYLTDGIDKAGVHFPWAFTGTAAANVYAPLLTSTDTSDIIVPPGRSEGLARALGLQPAEKGANVTLIERHGTSLQFRDIHPEAPSYFASPFILYLDLLDGRGRNKELAEHVLAQLDL